MVRNLSISIETHANFTACYDHVLGDLECIKCLGADLAKYEQNAHTVPMCNNTSIKENESDIDNFTAMCIEYVILM